MNEQESNQSGVVRWLQLLAAVGIPLLLAYLAFAGLVNPQFAELRDLISDNRDLISSNRDLISSNRDLISSNRDLISSNRDLISSNREAIAANASSIQRLEDKLDSSVDRLEARIDLVIEVLILAFTNDNITEAELRNVLNAGEE